MTVGFRKVLVVDRAAGTPARGTTPARPDRRLQTFVWYPAAGSGAAAALPGPYPLVVFAHGFNVTPATYAPLLRGIAAAGYVVAAPEFPISAAGSGGPAREDDLANQALDIRATISTLLASSARAGWLSGRLASHEIAVMGHSDGGETVAANILIAGDYDGRIGAAVIVAGQLPAWGRVDPVDVPTLVVQGSGDTVNPPELSQRLFRRLSSPKWYLDVVGATHEQTAVGTDASTRIERRAIVAYLNAILGHRPRALAQLQQLGNEPGVTELTSDVAR